MKLMELMGLIPVAGIAAHELLTCSSRASDLQLTSFLPAAHVLLTGSLQTAHERFDRARKPATSILWPPQDSTCASHRIRQIATK